MIDLTFQIEQAEVVPLAMAPQLAFRLRIKAVETCRELPFEAVLLRVQIRMEPTRRSYPRRDSPGLCELFGEPQRWGATMRSLLWTHASVLVPAFVGETEIDLPVECSHDFNVAATKYFEALEEGDAPLCFLFSGTCFYATDRGLQAAQISWEREANYRLPVATWRKMMAQYYPNCAWLRLDRQQFDALHAFKVRESLPTWEQAIERLLAQSTDARPVASAR